MIDINDLRNNGKLHVWENGKQEWRLPNGKLHRLDGPAEIAGGANQEQIDAGGRYTHYRIDNKIIACDPDTFNRYIDNTSLKEIYHWLKDHNLSSPRDQMSNELEVEFKLRFL